LLADDAGRWKLFYLSRPVKAIRSPSAGAVAISMSTIVFIFRDGWSAPIGKAAALSGRARFAGLTSLPPGSCSLLLLDQPNRSAAANLFFDVIGQKTFPSAMKLTTANVIKLAGISLLTAVIESLGEAFAFGRKFGVTRMPFWTF